ncbi:Sulfur carrier protein ThiS adenylyltransferase [Salinivirga cyanobacteriivorans]|uniref:Sulfur carrier protein ThiS adenylyltransferase n=1 Tax=Salinivirga cyanobacteriivorans TaxID=1307839 RepID=A0A0S2HZU4_9BACT|nr:tRNA threonylcarbamoyladenosine dehydratase [Salinivirga cyanobacteriivorans]ALO15635.1 Sulfur carrier protein ThiS adenylyltransferase [Salinivirga cyanobacteriivorans]
MNWNSRTELLLGQENINRLGRANVLVVGLGGVGAMAAEQLARAGVGKMTIADADIIEPSNINRQLPATRSTIEQKKVEVMASRLQDIHPELELNVLDEYLRDQRMVEVLEPSFDYVVDAIDTLAPKVYLIYHTLQNGYPVVSSMGSGGKTDPSMVSIADIAKTHHCQLARMVRKKLYKLGVRKGVRAVYSPEATKKRAVIEEHSTNKASNVGTISYMPAIFGCFCASEVILNLTKKPF